MKEAAGEANMTAVTIILIGAIASVVIPMVRRSMESVEYRANCMACGGYMWQDYCVIYNPVSKNEDIVNPDTCTGGLWNH